MGGRPSDGEPGFFVGGMRQTPPACDGGIDGIRHDPVSGPRFAEIHRWWRPRSRAGDFFANAGIFPGVFLLHWIFYYRDSIKNFSSCFVLKKLIRDCAGKIFNRDHDRDQKIKNED